MGFSVWRFDEGCLVVASCLSFNAFKNGVYKWDKCYAVLRTAASVVEEAKAVVLKEAKERTL